MTESDADSRGYYTRKIRRLSQRCERDKSDFESRVEVPDDELAMEYLRKGFGPAVSLYIEGRTGGKLVRFSRDEFTLLEDSMNDWLVLYARCYGEEINANHTIRSAAKTLLDTRNVRDTAQVLTRVP